MDDLIFIGQFTCMFQEIRGKNRKK